MLVMLALYHWSHAPSPGQELFYVLVALSTHDDSNLKFLSSLIDKVFFVHLFRCIWGVTSGLQTCKTGVLLLQQPPK
jgi:hypothetical protein